MSSQTRMIQAVTSIDVISELMELIKNPDSIVNAHNIIREQIYLTDIQTEKMKEAKLFLQKYDILKTELDNKEEKLKKDISQHVDNVNIFESLKKDSDILLNKKLNEFSKKENDFKDLKSQYSDTFKDLEIQKNKFLQNKLKIENNFSDKEEYLEDLEIKLNKKQEDITIQEKLLKDKAIKLQSIIG